MQDFYTLIDDTGQFVYFVSGQVKTDTVPRKSCAFGQNDSQRFIDRATRSCNKEADRSQRTADNYLANHPNTSVDYTQGLQNKVDTLRNKTFAVVKVSFTLV